MTPQSMRTIKHASRPHSSTQVQIKPSCTLKRRSKFTAGGGWPQACRSRRRNATGSQQRRLKHGALPFNSLFLLCQALRLPSSMGYRALWRPTTRRSGVSELKKTSARRYTRDFSAQCLGEDLLLPVLYAARKRCPLGTDHNGGWGVLS